MRRAALIKRVIEQVGTIANLASVFEGIASMDIGKIRHQALSSKAFFADLWHIYSQLRVGKAEAEKRNAHLPPPNPRNMFVVITSQGGLSGDIDSQVVDFMLKDYQPSTTDIICVGGHGATLLGNRGVQISKLYRMPGTNQGFGATVVEPIVREVMHYGQGIAYYQTYSSLSNQEVEKIELRAGVQAMSEESGSAEEIISERDYDFEPSLIDILDYLETVMLGVVVSQGVLESKLSQAASRFNAMIRAKQKAKEMEEALKLAYNRARRAANEERTREIVAVMN